MSLTKEEKKKWIQTIRKNPEIFFSKVLKVKKLWDGEKRILSAIANHSFITVPSGHSLGKDFIGGGLPLWFLSCYYPAKVIMTAPTDRQVESIMWAELTTHYERAGGEEILGGKLLKRKFVLDEKNWFCIAFTTRETKTQVGKFQGFHSQNVLVIVSEAQAIDDNIYKQIEGISTSENIKIILLGNPLRNTGFFAKSVKSREYYTVRLNCLDNPNFIHNEEIVPGLASRAWCERMLKRYGEDSPIYQARVLGIVPEFSIDSLIPLSLAQLAVERKLIIPYNKKRRGVSVDPASFGDDECVLAVYEEGKEIYKESFSYTRTTQISARAILLKEEYKADVIIVDSVGEGRGVVDELVQANQEVIDFKGSFRNGIGEQYENQRAEAHMFAREMFRDGLVSITNDELLIEELTEIKFFTNKKGKFQIEAKEDIKDRLKRSPNRADALIQWLWVLKKDIIYKVEEKKRYKSHSYEEEAEGAMAC